MVYCDDCLFFSANESNIDALLEELKVKCKLDLNVENDVAGFLGVHIDRRNDGTIELTQKGLIERTIATLGLAITSNSAQTPAEKTALGSDPNGEP